MIKKFLTPKYILIAILIFTFLTRAFLIAYPKTYVFDEVYHAFTAKEYLISSHAAWDPWAMPPKGVAYEWTHPPLAKEIMALSMIIFNSTDPWTWRLPGVIFGTLSVFLVYKLAEKLFRKTSVALLSAFIFSLEGLTLVQSRTGMNDIYLIVFLLAAFLFFFEKRYFYSALFVGLGLASKWTALYTIPVFIALLIYQKQSLKSVYFIVLPLIIYLISYIPYFMLGFNPTQFIQLQQQMWWYHTRLKAVHDYMSPWWSWPFDLYPVWYFVDYAGNNTANIFASGNPIVFWLGIPAIILTVTDFIKKRTYNLGLLLIGYFIFFLPWAFSPRIMFLYHYSPSVPFLSIILGYQLNFLYENQKKRSLLITLLLLMFLGFIFIYPFLVGIPLPKSLVRLFFFTNMTKNPFNY